MKYNSEKWYIRAQKNFRAMFHILVHEINEIFKDRGVVIITLIAPLVYPLLYCGMYKNETLIDVPVGIVDMSHSSISDEYTRKLDATRDLFVFNRYTDLHQAKNDFYSGKIHGIIFIGSDFSKNINTGKQAVVSVYSDMSSFMYYRAMALATNYVALEIGEKIQAQRLSSLGYTDKQTSMSISPVEYESTILFNQGMGFASFLMPAILILIIHQTLFFGIGMAAGTAREENRFNEFVSPTLHRGKIYRVVFGKSLAFFFMYLLLSVYIIGIVPEIFGLPQTANPVTIIEFIVPFLLATIFFSMTLSVFNPSREAQLILTLFFSLILLFLSGISWPQSNIPWFWKIFSYLFPATFGIQGYIKINTMGASVNEIQFELIALWIQTVVYFALATVVYYWQIRKGSKKVKNNIYE